MGLGATRRFLGALVAISTALLPVLVQPVAAGAASTGTLYGLVAASGTFSLGTVDPVSAAITPGVNVGLAPGQPGPAPGYGPWANDPNTHRFFLARVWNVSPWPPPPIQSFELLTVNVLTGTITARPTLARNLDSLVFDTSSGTLFGISADKQIVRVDPSTGVMTNLGAVTGDYFHMEIASASHTIYILSRTNGTIATRLITMDTLTNAVTTGPVLAPGVRGMVYDTSLGALFGLTFCCPSQLVRINPVSGVGTGVGGANLGLGGAFAIDSATHTAFVTQDVLGAFDLNQYIASINVLTGVKSLSPAIPSRTANVSRLMFEPLGGTPPPVDTSPPVTSIAPSPAANAAG